MAQPAASDPLSFLTITCSPLMKHQARRVMVMGWRHSQTIAQLIYRTLGAGLTSRMAGC
ncbi:hypothetical protein O3W44_19835 [Pantoea sp. LMR881]|uniref:hypothetical protein n=1 Tax=Pantoea sp. LMR881 TaxID=3014336 RepID=UPI0022AF5671|nr:hypothetical protein [Pantoea sp. LMR881]MCZ4060851.1 hypothetical protein [Pantoea sp. LMR881]